MDTSPAWDRPISSLYTDHYELTMLQAALHSGAAERRTVFEAFARGLPEGRRFGIVAGTGRLLAGLADQACDAWRHRDAGLWELERREHYTSSKLSCWQALRCAYHLAQMGQIPGEPTRWAAEAERIRAWVHENCWSDRRRAFVWYPGTEELDTSLLLHAGSGFLIPPGTPHDAHDLGPGTGVMLSTYLVDPDQPLSSFVGAPPGADAADATT